MSRALFAFVTVVIVWSTTPLGINWSVADGYSQFAAFLRMAIGLVLVVILLLIARLPLPTDRRAWLRYGVGSLGIYGTMTCVYLASDDVSSGLVAVIHGLIPMQAALFSWPILKQRTPFYGILGLLIACLGLALVFFSEIQVSAKQWPWLLLIVVGVGLQALGAVLIKKIHYPMHPLQQLAGTLLVVVVGFIINTTVSGQWQPNLGNKALAATVYLAVIGSVIGFYAYFTALQRLSAVQVGLITLISPVFAVILGNTLNSETMPTFTLVGSVIIGIGLATYLARVGITSGENNG